MPDAMIERVAVAIREGLNADWRAHASDDDLRNVEIEGTADLLVAARAVITAMREPTEVMTQAGARVRSGNDDQYLIGPEGIFSAMIDAALAEEG